MAVGSQCSGVIAQPNCQMHLFRYVSPAIDLCLARNNGETNEHLFAASIVASTGSFQPVVFRPVFVGHTKA